MEKDRIKRTLKLIGTAEWILGIFAFISSYLTVNSPYDSPGNLENIVFYGLFGVALFISGTFTYLKSLDFLENS
ncbi:MAG: hypothetical protein ACXABU_16635 [Candidatus Hodarchaeales archaeon]|jgi:hypothetical protein